MNMEGPCAPRDQPEKESKREKGRKKERHGRTRFSWNWSVSLFFREAFILYVVHRDKCKKQSHGGSDPYLKTECSLLTFVLTRVLCLFTISSGLETD